MALLRNLLGNNPRDRELSDEMRAVLEEMRAERDRFEKLIEDSRGAAELLASLGEPIARVTGEATAATARLAEVEQRMTAIGDVAARVDTVDERSQGLLDAQREAEARLASVVEDSQHVRAIFEELGQKMDGADGLRDRLEAFLEVEKPFRILQGEADAIRGQVEGTTEQLGRLREQHDRLMDAHKLGTSKMEALDRRREELSRDLQDKERRVIDVERLVREMDGIRQGVIDAKRSMGSLKSLTDSVAQKAAALEAQGDAVERALAQADQLERAMRELDAGVRRQEANEKSLDALQASIDALTSLHDGVLERSSEISALQAESAERTAAIRDQLAAARDEAKNAVERFDFEGKGLESVSQRVADLRSALTEFENRFRNLSESSATVRDLGARTQVLVPQVETLRTQVAGLEDDMTKLEAIRRDLDEAGRTARTLGSDVARIVEGRPAVDATLADFERLGGTHAMVKDALEQTRGAHAEIARMVAAQAETRTWLLSVERSLTDLRTRFGALDAVTPTLEVVERQAGRITESIAGIEARREFLDELNRRLTECAALSATLDERGLTLQERMDAAEQRFLHFASHAREADRISDTVARVAASVSEAVRQAETTGQSVAAIEARCAAVEDLAERTRTLKETIEQRQGALEAAARDLESASTLRQEAADAAQKLGTLSRQLDATLAATDTRATTLAAMAGTLEQRAGALGAVEARLAEFEQRLARWDVVDQQVSRTLEQISTRQGTVQALQADLERMFAMAETTCENVRTITSAQRETAESRAVLLEIRTRLEEVSDLARTLDERERQMSRAEERLARAEGFLVDVRSGMESLQGQRALVDQAVEKVGSLRFLLKQAEAMIDGLREERKMTSDVHEARASGSEDEAEDDVDQAA